MKKTTDLAFLSLAVIVAGLLATPASAQLVPETILTASDASFDDRLGQAVDIDGNVAIAGANRNSDAGNNSGSAYLFDVTTGEELFKLTASDAAAGDVFGHSVAIDGNTAFVSATGNSDAGENSGSVYLFDVATGEELMKLTASDAAEGDYFGHGLDISGNTAIVGAYHDDDKGNSSGSAYVYDVTTGDELFKLTASDGAAHDWFGYWVAIDGNIAIVGARRADGAGVNSGSAYVFDVTTGEELMKLTASDAAEGDEFGRAVGISGYTAVVSSENDDEAGYNSGSAYVYDLTFGDLLVKLTPSDGVAGAQFSTAVEISGSVALSGAWKHNNASGLRVGQAYLYDVSTLLPPGADFNHDGTVDNADLLIWESSNANQHLDFNGDGQVDDADHLLWEQTFHTEILFDDSPANLDQQGPVDNADLLIWEQSYGVDDLGDVDDDGNTDGVDFLEWQREFTPYEAADANRDRLVDESDLEGWDAAFGWIADADGDGILDGDANGDGIVSDLDFLWWQRQSTHAAAMATSVQVPEPASCLLFFELLVACIVGCRYRCWQR